MHRVALLSMHTSPAESPGSGDAGGMNVYLAEVMRRLPAHGCEVTAFAQLPEQALPRTVELAPGATVVHLDISGAGRRLSKQQMVQQIPRFSSMVSGHYDHIRGEANVIHSHYWLSGLAGLPLAARWQVPLIHTMHTLAAVKNAHLAKGDRAEPEHRLLGERSIAAGADTLVVNTEFERADLVRYLQVPERNIAVVPPGVDTAVFVPESDASVRVRVSEQLRASIGVGSEVPLVLFVGRIQALKGPDIVLQAFSRSLSLLADLRGSSASDPHAVFLGGDSGQGVEDSQLAALKAMAHRLGIAERVHFLPPQSRENLADWYRSSDVLMMPSANESFGLVALEAQACGTPVLATAVGGLQTIIADGVSGELLANREVSLWASRLAALLVDSTVLERYRAAAPLQAQRFSWDRTAQSLARLYLESLESKKIH